MKARLESGKVVKYSKIPSEWSGVMHYMAGFNNASTAALETEGFFDVIEPVYDSVIQTASNLHLDNAYGYTDVDGNELTRAAFVYDIGVKVIPQSLEELKVKRIQSLKSLGFGKLTPTDWYVTRKAEHSAEIPSDIQEERDAVRASIINKENEINALTIKASVLRYDINF